MSNFPIRICPLCGARAGEHSQRYRLLSGRIVKKYRFGCLNSACPLFWARFPEHLSRAKAFRAWIRKIYPKGLTPPDYNTLDLF